jgi:PII-like signaling protein
MLQSGPAKKVSIHVGEDQQYHGNSLYAAILDFLFYRGISGASVVRGIAGFGADHHLHTTRILRLAENLPVTIEFVEAREKVDEVLPKLAEMVGNGLIEVNDTTVVKADGSASKPPKSDAQGQSVAPHLKKQASAKLMRIYIGESDRWNDKPLYQALVECMRANEIAGVTVYQGILGYGANRRMRKDRALSLSHDRPIMLSVVDTEDKLRALTPFLDDMIKQGLVVFSDVEIIKYAHGLPPVDPGEAAKTK